MKRTELSKKLGISRQALYKRLRRPEIDLDTLARMAGVLRMPLEDLRTVLRRMRACRARTVVRVEREAL